MDTQPLAIAPWEPYPTADGSITFLSSEFGEHFHSLKGAWDEALIKFVGPTQLAPLAAERDSIRILDICYGLGYNSAAALMVIWSIAPQCRVQWLGLELDPSVAIAALPEVIAQLQRSPGTSLPPGTLGPSQEHAIVFTAEAATRTAQVLTHLAQQGSDRTDDFEGTLRWGDARQTFGQGRAENPPGQEISGGKNRVDSGQDLTFDAIFLDPFSPPQCPQLWTVEFLTAVARSLAPQGYLATYSCAAAVRSALQEAGLELGASPPFGRRWPGTVAAYPRCGETNPRLPPLSLQELEHLQTRAAVPYRDRQGTDSRDVVLARRRQEQERSPLEPTSRWKRRWFGDCRASHR